jgi:ankyrin repeat protein
MRCRILLCVLLASLVSLPVQAGEIHKAVTNGDLNKVVALLRDHPDLLESKDNLGRTPLFVAVAHNRLEIAELLLANGADVNARDGDQHTPLIQSLWVYRHDKMMRLLLAKGAEVNLSDKWNMSALNYAAKQGQIEDVKILIANDADINLVTGTTPLMYAIFGDHRELVELLLASGADVDHRVNGYTPLHYARLTDDAKIEALIRKYGGHE